MLCHLFWLCPNISLEWDFFFSMPLLKFFPSWIYFCIMHLSPSQNTDQPLFILVNSRLISSFYFPGEAHLNITRLFFAAPCCCSAVLFKLYMTWISWKALLKHSLPGPTQKFWYKIWGKAPKFALVASYWVMQILES